MATALPHLCLTRKEGESFTVDGPAQIVINRIEGGKARISVNAPISTRILRDELKPCPEDQRDGK